MSGDHGRIEAAARAIAKRDGWESEDGWAMSFNNDGEFSYYECAEVALAAADEYESRAG